MADVHLTLQQQNVVDNRGGTLLVSAAAGSGKTKVLVDRVIRRIVNEGKNINEFLIITFTNAAAAELRGKISDALTNELALHPENRHLMRQMNLLHLSQISTVHAFCGELIRQYGYLLEVPSDYRILEESERQELLNKQVDVLLENAYTEENKDFQLLTNTLGAGRTDQALGDLIINIYEKLQSQPYPQRWLRQQEFFIRPETEIAETPWGKIILHSAQQQLSWLIARYDWAISCMEGDAQLEKQYLPCYKMHKSALTDMLQALDGPWDDISSHLTMEYPRVSVYKYPDQYKLEAIKAVKNDGKELLENLNYIFSRKSSELKGEQNELAPALSALLELVGKVDKRFSEEKRRKNLLDFGDQEHLAIRLLIRPESGMPTEIAKEVAGRYAEIMVDEYQDSNRIQEMIFTAIASGNDENRFLVGDVKQSIYGFRQAEPKIFLEKYRTFLPAKDANQSEPRKLVLSKNFRSRPEILDAVNHVFSTVMSEAVGDIIYGPDERLYTGLDEYPATGNKHVELHVLELKKLASDNEETKYQREAAWVTKRILKLLEENTMVRNGDELRPVQPEDIAILFRTRDPISIYSKALQEAGIPVATEGGEDLFETPEVKVITNLLKVLSNPHQDIPLLTVLCSPIFRFSNEQLAQIRAGSKKARFYDAMQECQEPWCMHAVERLEKLRHQANSESAERLVWSLLYDTGLLAAYSAMDNGKKRCENLWSIYQIALNSTAGDFLYLYQFNRILDRQARTGSMLSKQNLAGVTLTTMHQSKGLEYPVVILADLSRKFNFRELNDSVLFDGDIGIASKITNLKLRIRYPGLCYEALKQKKRTILRSEEMRILYVAMTRPKDYLIMTYAAEKPEPVLTRLRPGAGCPAAEWATVKAGCLGDWILLAALNRIESGALFERCGRPDCQLLTSDMPWLVTYECVDERIHLSDHMWKTSNEPAEAPHVSVNKNFSASLCWKDLHYHATITPSKLTATQLKGRAKDTEAAEGAKVQTRSLQLKRPEFILEEKGLSPTERGTAVHMFLQYARFEDCLTEDGVEAEKNRLEDEEFMTSEQLTAVEPKDMIQLFHAELGQRILSAQKMVREFKFSILEDAENYYPDVHGEQILLQGVVDVAFWERDNLYVVDFKTDRVTEKNLQQRVEYYRRQLETYKNALEHIFSTPVHGMYLYFLSIGKEVQL